MKKYFVLLLNAVLMVQYAGGHFLHQLDSVYTFSLDTSASDSVKLHRESVIDSSLLLTKPFLVDSLYESSPDSLKIVTDSSRKLRDTLSLVLVGDVMLGTNYPSPQYLPPGNNCAPLLDSVKQYLQDADLTFCNLEGVFAGENGTPKGCKDPKVCYVFRMPDEYVNCLIDAGFDLVSVANNHVNDFGYQGRNHAVKVLKEAGLHFAGFIEYPYTMFQIDSLWIGFCAFSTNSGVMDLRMSSMAEQIVRFLADTCDIVLISMHGGAEGSDYQHVTRKSESFLGADRGNVYKFAHQMIDAGADVIIGHGPHVTRAMEIYNDRFIAYSLGNFCTYARFNLSGPNGIAPLVRIKIDKEGRFIQGNIIPVKQLGEGGSQIDHDKKVIFKLQGLQQADFPENTLVIDNDGHILQGSKASE